MENNADRISHKEMIASVGSTIASPVTGSMKPLIRPKRDCAVFIRPDRELKKFDVVLYSRGKHTVMHRIIGIREDGPAGKTIYIVRGDNSYHKEEVPEGQIHGLMTGCYRDETYISCESRRYRLLSRLVVKSNRLGRQYHRVRRRQENYAVRKGLIYIA